MVRVLALIFVLTACAQRPILGPDSVEPMDQGEYQRLISRHTASTDQYSGLYQTFQAHVTMLTTEVQSATLRQRASFLQWTQRDFQTEREKAVQEANAYAKFFMRFYSPEHEYDDLHKGKSIWKVFLEYKGNRFEGKVTKVSQKFVELRSIFPYMDRFSTPYEITFNVPMTTIEQNDVKVILTSSLGQAEFNFPARK